MMLGVRRSRTAQLLVLGILIVFIVLKGILPLLVSTAAVKSSMEQALSVWTGGRATIVSEPDVSFWPSPTITMHWVKIESTESTTSEELASAQSVTAAFSVMAALRGDPVFYDFRLVNPLLKIERRADGSLNWNAGGRLAKAIAGVSAPAPTSEDTGADDALGTIVIENGTLLLTDRLMSGSYRVTDIAGTIKWPTLGSRLDGSLTAKLNGEKADWTFVCDEPLLLFSGANASVRTALVSAPLNVNFEGIGNLSANAFASGTLGASAPSLAALLSWYGIKTQSSDNLGQISLDATMTTAGSTIKLDGLRLGMQDTQGTGVLDISLPVGKQPQVSGTLALDDVDLKAFLSFLSPLPADADDIAETVNMTFLQEMRLDLRLSAQRAVFGPVPLTELAAGVLIENGRASLNIGSSTFADGELSGRLAVSQEGFEGGGDLQLSLKNADFGSAINILGLKGPLPVGRGTINIMVASKRPLWATSAKDLSGNLQMTADNGFINNFNEPGFDAMIAKGGFFNMTDVADGSFDFSSVDIEADLSNGLAEIDKAVIVGTDETIHLSGVIPYSSGSLALAGTIEPTAATDGTPAIPSVNFFVGGSWPEPVISPLSVLTGRPPG